MNRWSTKASWLSLGGQLFLASALLLLAASSGATASNRLALVVNSDLRPLVEPNLTEFLTDLNDEGYDAFVREWDLTEPDENSPEELKAWLESEANSANLIGAIFVGDLPVPWYRHAHDFNDATVDFPCDIFYMDLGNSWVDSDGDGKLDRTDSTPVAAIWVSRIKASHMNVFSSLNEADLVVRYLEKNHRFRSGELRLADRALQWSDSDWKTSTPASLGLSGAYAAANCTRVTEAVAGITTNRADWMGRWGEDYETEYFQCHSGATSHSPGGTVSVTEVAAGDIKRLFWNCWNCSSGKFTVGNYIAGVRLFCEEYGLLAYATTKTGGMWPYLNCYNHLGGGVSHGAAFQMYYTYNAASRNKNDAYICWRRGLVILGDGTLKLGRHMLAFSGSRPLMDSYAVDEDGNLAVPAASGVLANDGPGAGGVRVLHHTSYGLLDLQSDGSFSYVPGRDFRGADVFAYTIDDANGGRSQPASVTLTVRSVNDPPGLSLAASPVIGPKPLRVSFSSGTADKDADGQEEFTWHWEFGTGDTSSERDPTYQYDVAGKYLVRVTVSDGLDSASDTVTIKVFAGGTDFQTWAGNIPWNGADSSETGDADTDKISNLLEFFLNSDPLCSSPQHLPKLEIIPAGDGGCRMVRLRFRCNGDMSGVSHAVQTSLDLENWIDEPIPAGYVGDDLDDTPLFEFEKELKDDREDRLFLRLRAWRNDGS